MKKLSWKVKFGLVLVAVSAVLLYLHSVAFHHTPMHEWGLFFLTHEIAIMPLEVLVVTLVIHSLLDRREHEEKMHKLNMVIGAFFSEVGDELLRRSSALDETVEVREHFLVTNEWDARRYASAKAAILAYDYGLSASAGQLGELKGFIIGKRQFLLGLLQNPSLLEHETFTNALWAVFHLSEELGFRQDFAVLPESDIIHLNGDLQRAYAAIAVEWLDHVQHLQKQYPYLFSLAVRRNPLDTSASVVVTG
ncbi:MAG: hypothetical protein JW733_02935 [Coriobacteriia bacterium]|nr:hypothetical protein [Coriobacteriia bacterium]MBN2841200.1 hypothetical protein [Coriobacteriia bacterium]